MAIDPKTVENSESFLIIGSTCVLVIISRDDSIIEVAGNEDNNVDVDKIPAYNPSDETAIVLVIAKQTDIFYSN